MLLMDRELMPVTSMGHYQLSEKGHLCLWPLQSHTGHFSFGLQLLSRAQGSGLRSVAVGTGAGY